MKHSPAQIQLQILRGKNIVNEPNEEGLNDLDWPSFYSRLPPQPGRALAITNTSPVTAADLLQGPKLVWHGTQVMLRVEKNDHSDGWAKAEFIKDFFEGLSEQKVRVENVDYLVHRIWCVDGVNDTGPEEETERPIFTINYLLHITKV